MAALTNVNQGSQAFRRLRRFLQGKGVNYRRSVGIAGAAASTNITVPGLGLFDELISVKVEPYTTFVQALTGGSAPASVPANSTSKQTFTITGVQASDLAIDVNFQGSQTANIGIAGVRVTAANTVEITFINPSAAPATPAAGAYLFQIQPNTAVAGGAELMTQNFTPAVQATFTTAIGGNSDLKFIAQSAYLGSKGNAITIAYVNPGTPNFGFNSATGVFTPAVAVVGTAITVTLATNASSVVVSLANDVLNALKQSFAATGVVVGLVDVDLAAGQNGTGTVAAVAATALSGGVDPNPMSITIVEAGAVPATFTTAFGGNADLKFLAQSAYPGTKGNAITIAYVNPGTPNFGFNSATGVFTPAVSVVGTAITVTLATNASSVVVSVANDVLNALKQSFAATGVVVGLVDIDLAAGQNGTGTVAALAATALSGGVDPSVAINIPGVSTLGAVLDVDFLSRLDN